MTWETWAVFVLTETALCLAPGPAVLFVASRGLRHGAARSLWANLGILSGNAFYFGLSATGLGALLLASHDLFLVVKWAGAAYLVYLGVITFRARGGGMAIPPGDRTAAAVSGLRLLGQGFVLQAANPKALVFFTALLPQFVRTGEPVAPQMLVLGVSSVVVEFLVLAGYGALAGRAARAAGDPRFSRIVNRVSGVFLVGAGAGLALARE